MPRRRQLKSAEPAKPSQDFFGLTVGAIGCRPNSTPATYPPTSLRTVRTMKIDHPVRAVVGTQRGAPRNAARNGTYMVTNTPAVMSRT